MTDIPRLAIFQNQSTVSIFDLVGAASGLCRIVWVIGWDSNSPSARVLGRFGDVADVTGMNKSEVIEHLRSYRLDGVAVFNDPPLILAAAVGEALGLRFHSPKTAAILSDKLLQRQILKMALVPVPPFAAVTLKDHRADVPFPAVLKPRVGAGARDTFLVHSVSDISDALGKCDSSEQFILEQWLPDRQREHTLSADVVSVESVVRSGVFTHVMVTGRFPYEPPFRDTGGFLPSELERNEWESVCELAATAARIVGIRDGVIHTEIKMTPAGPRIVEINGRLGGGVSKLIERIGGPSMYVWVMRLALGQEVGTFSVREDSPISFFHFVVAPESATGIVSASGIEELGAMKDQLGIDEIQVNFQPGDAVSTQQTSFTANVIRIEGVVPSYQDLTATLEKIKATLQLTWSF
jgi:predicted ATP-grasp superfamily ATP-dependent carboligase